MHWLIAGEPPPLHWSSPSLSPHPTAPLPHSASAGPAGSWEEGRGGREVRERGEGRGGDETGGGSVLVSPLAATEEPTLAVAGLLPAVWWDTLTSCLWRAAGVWSGLSECHSQNTRAPDCVRMHSLVCPSADLPLRWPSTYVDQVLESVLQLPVLLLVRDDTIFLVLTLHLCITAFTVWHIKPDLRQFLVRADTGQNNEFKMCVY